MTVKEVLSLLSFGERFELVDAKTGKRLCCSLNNKKESFLLKSKNHSKKNHIKKNIIVFLLFDLCVVSGIVFFQQRVVQQPS